MSAKAMKLVTVSSNGQISIGKAWAGRQIRVEEVNHDEIRISSGIFVPDSQRIFFTAEAKESLSSFDAFEATKPARGSDTKAIFAALKRKKASAR